MSKEIVIKAEHISKLYRLGQVGTGTLSHDLKRWWALLRGKEDPYMKVGMENVRTQKATGDYAWALKDVSFDIRQGDTLGIIGKNGAGKSTLLKLLSRVTSPTTGEIKIKGRIASLLEVGTGFHPEMTGRENIYMNGAILGMTKKEISRKFDEIVDFAGVEMYIDTPVKRYSSGMYVRLAFGVAAHLEPEILIVDEVLAVGDAEFQKKCLGKMGDVAGHGRTIIFVSHNMQAVQSLCKTTMYLKAGQIADYGQTSPVIDNYLSREITSCMERRWEIPDEAPGNEKVRLVCARVMPHHKDMDTPILITDSLALQFEFVNYLDNAQVNLSLFLNTTTGVCIFNLGTKQQTLKHGQICYAELEIPANFLNDNIYTVNLYFVMNGSTVYYTIDDLLTFEVVDHPRDGSWFGDWPGVVRPALNFKLE